MITPPKDPRFRPPDVSSTPGAAFFWRSDQQGWDHPPLYLPRPLLILRVTDTDTRVESPAGSIVAISNDRLFTPFRWMDEILAVLGESTAGSERRLLLRPSFPIAVVSMSWEFGRTFTPHEHCFPHADSLDHDLLHVSFHATGFVRLEGRWRRMGRPPHRGITWGNWRPTPRDVEDPPPPEIAADTTSKALARNAVTDAAFVESPRPGLAREDHARAVDRIQAHLAAGDIYQANLTTRLEGMTSASPERIFGEGLARGGDRYAALVRASNATHVSFSPELLVRRFGRSVVTKPIKGTRPVDPAAPPGARAAAARELLASAKDRAEHIMIVDLERNDLGRLCEYNTVRVDPLLAVSHHPMLVHLESTVHGTLRSRVTTRDLLAALFPGGSVSGAPKKRALEVIASLENRPRGIYCGALGWVDARGDCELNLPIRTATVLDDGRVHLHAGGGIVADSNPDDEWQELHHKLRFLLESVQVASLRPTPRA